MADIQIVRQHGLGKARARQVAEEIAQQLQAQLGAAYAWEGDEVVVRYNASFAKVDGAIRVGEQEMEIAVNLGGPAKLMRGPIEQRIREELDQRLG